MRRPIDRREIVGTLLKSMSGAAFIGLAGCSGPGNTDIGATSALGTQPGSAGATQQSKSQVKIALLLPLTGGLQTAAVAKAMREAAELAVFDQKSVDIQLIVKDDKGTEDGARAAAEDAVAAGAEIILGPLFSKSVRAAAAVARKAKIPVIAFSNDPSVAGNDVYLLSFAPAIETARIVDFAARSGRRVFAALLPDDAEGRVLEPAFRAAVQRAGATLAFTSRFTIESNGLISAAADLREQVQAAASSSEPIEALFLPGGQDTLAQLSQLAVQAGIVTSKVKLLGTSGWDFPGLQLTARLHGGWFAAPDPRGWSDLAERYGKAYRSMPPRLASLSHDAVALAGALVGAPKGQRFTAATITRSSGFSGADGQFRFTSSGIAERGLAILEVQKSGPVVIDRPVSGETGSSAAVSMIGGATPRTAN